VTKGLSEGRVQIDEHLVEDCASYFDALLLGAPPALPGIITRMTLSDSRHDRRLSRR